MNVLRLCLPDFIIWLTAADFKSSQGFLTVNQINFAQTHLSGNKKADFLRSRALLNYIAGQPIDFASDPTTKSSFSNGNTDSTTWSTPPSEKHGGVFVSLSHKKNFAAVVTSDLPNFGVDLEFLKVTHLPLRDKVLSPTERDRFSPEKLETVTAFSFKEAVFKAINRKFPDLKSFHQCEITEVENATIRAKIVASSALGIQLVGSIFYLKNDQGNFVITVARPK